MNGGINMKKKDLINFVKFGLTHDVESQYILEDILKILEDKDYFNDDIDKLIESYKR